MLRPGDNPILTVLCGKDERQTDSPRPTLVEFRGLDARRPYPGGARVPDGF